MAMSSDNKEINKAFEEVIRRNITVMQDFTNETRKLVREAENKIAGLQQENRDLKHQMSQLRTMLANVQAKVYSGGT